MDDKPMIIQQETKTVFSGEGFIDVAAHYAEHVKARGIHVSVKIYTTSAIVFSKVTFRASRGGTGWQKSDL